MLGWVQDAHTDVGPLTPVIRDGYFFSLRDNFASWSFLFLQKSETWNTFCKRKQRQKKILVRGQSYFQWKRFCSTLTWRKLQTWHNWRERADGEQWVGGGNIPIQLQIPSTRDPGSTSVATSWTRGMLE